MSSFHIDIDEATLAAQRDGLVIGADPEVADIVVPDPSLAARHARLRRIDGRLWLEDLNSGGGTWVDGVRLHPFAAFPYRVGNPLRLAAADVVLALRGPATGSTAEATPAPARRRRRPVLLAVLAGILLIVSVVGLGLGYRYYEAWQTDLAAWRAALAEDTEEAYRTYLRIEPDGVRAGDAYAALSRIAATRIAEDDALFDEATLRDTIEAYQGYIDARPDGRHVATAEQSVARLQADADAADAAEADAEAWRTAQAADSRAGYQRYLSAFPQGAHADAARQQLDRIAQAAAAAAAAEKRRQEEAEVAKRREAEAKAAWDDARKRHTVAVYERFVERYPDAAEAPQALNYIGYMHANAEGVPQDHAKALDYFRRAADGGSAEAMQNLGYHYHHGMGVAPNPEEAARWYRRAIDAGNRPAEALLRLLQRETGVP